MKDQIAFTEIYLDHRIEIRQSTDLCRYVAWIDGSPLMSPKDWLVNSVRLQSIKSVARRRIREIKGLPKQPIGRPIAKTLVQLAQEGKL